MKTGDYEQARFPIDRLNPSIKSTLLRKARPFLFSPLFEINITRV